MKIALIRQRYNPYGGAERFVERAMESLAAEGAEISLITRSWEDAPAGHFQKIICDPSYSRLWSGRAARDRSFALEVQKLLEAGHYDISQSHERIPGCKIFRAGDGVHAAWLQHRSRQLSSMGKLILEYSPYHRYVLSAEKAMFNHPNLKMVICNSRMVVREVREYYGVDESKLQLIYNGLDTEYFHPEQAAPHRAALRQQLSVPPDCPLLLFVGSGFERKGVPALLQAFAAMTRKDARLIVVGADRKQEAMEKLAQNLGLKDQVYFAGPQKNMLPWYGAADAFVLPTLYDPCPNAALEALACGLPTVTSTTCGAQEWITEGENGWITDALDIPALSKRLDDLCELAPQASAREAARKSVEHLNLEAMGTRLLNLYHLLMA